MLVAGVALAVLLVQPLPAQTPALPSPDAFFAGENRLRGDAAVIEAPSGRGRVILHMFQVQHRRQTWGTFRHLFNSIFYGPAIARRPAPQTTLEQ